MGIGAGVGSRRRIAGAVAGVCALLGLVVLIGTAGDEPDEVVELADDPTTTSEPDETTSTSSSSTTSSTATSSTTTTSAEVEATTEPAPPPTTEPPSPPPPTTPPTTAPPPAPVTFGAMDVSAVRAFVSSHQTGGSGGFVATGEPPCPAQVPEGTDAGDNSIADVTEWDLMRTCDGRVRLRMPIADELYDVHWMELDTGPGGCRGVDLVVLAYDEGAGPTVTGVVATPGCASSGWAWRGMGAWPQWNGSWLELHFALPAGVQAITWQAFVRGRGEGAGGTDAVPNAPHTFAFG